MWRILINRKSSMAWRGGEEAASVNSWRSASAKVNAAWQLWRNVAKYGGVIRIGWLAAIIGESWRNNGGWRRNLTLACQRQAMAAAQSLWRRRLQPEIMAGVMAQSRKRKYRRPGGGVIKA
jgi:hypothetical protein